MFTVDISNELRQYKVLIELHFFKFYYFKLQFWTMRTKMKCLIIRLNKHFLKYCFMIDKINIITNI